MMKYHLDEKNCQSPSNNDDVQNVMPQKHENFKKKLSKIQYMMWSNVAAQCQRNKAQLTLGHPSAKMYVEGEIVETKLFVIISKLKLEIHSGNLEILRLFGKDFMEVAQLSFLSRKLRIQNLLHRCFLRSRMYVVYFLGAAAEQGKWLRNYLLMMNFWLKFSYGMSNDLITVL
ncbi:Cystatin-8 [Trichinella pseudospiralis]